MLMVISMKVIGSIIKPMDKENTLFFTLPLMKENGMMINNMDKV